CWIYDIKHQTAALLKRALERDPEWTAFAQQGTRTKQQVFLTPLAFLVAPQATARHGVALEELEEKLGWLRAYRAALQSWAEALQVIEVAEHYVRTEGIHLRAVSELRAQLKALGGGP